MNKGELFIQGDKENEWNKLNAWQKIIFKQYINDYDTDDEWAYIDNCKKNIYNVNGSVYKFIIENNNYVMIDLIKNIRRIIIELPYHKGIN